MQSSLDKMWEAWGRTNALYTAWCTAAGQNPYRLFVLYAIDTGRPLTQKEIAMRTGLSRQTVATVVRALKAEGLITLHGDTADRREKHVRFTAAGTAYTQSVLAPLYALEERVSAAVGARRMQQLAETIDLFALVFAKETEEKR